MRVVGNLSERGQGPVPLSDKNLCELSIADQMMKPALRKINVCAYLADLLPMMIVQVCRFDAPNEVVVFSFPDRDDRIMIESSCSLCSVFSCFAPVEHAGGFAVEAQYRLEVSVFPFHRFVPFVSEGRPEKSNLATPSNLAGHGRIPVSPVGESAAH